MGTERDAPPPDRAEQRLHDHLGLLAGELVKRGRPGDAYVRIRRENVGDFRRAGRGYLVATEATEAPRNPAARWIQQARDLLIGRPLPSEAIESEKMSVFKALPILSSDALSTSAFGRCGCTITAPSGSRQPCCTSPASE